MNVPVSLRKVLAFKVKDSFLTDLLAQIYQVLKNTLSEEEKIGLVVQEKDGRGFAGVMIFITPHEMRDDPAPNALSDILKGKKDQWEVLAFEAFGSMKEISSDDDSKKPKTRWISLLSLSETEDPRSFRRWMENIHFPTIQASKKFTNRIRRINDGHTTVYIHEPFDMLHWYGYNDGHRQYAIREFLGEHEHRLNSGDLKVVQATGELQKVQISDLVDVLRSAG